VVALVSDSASYMTLCVRLLRSLGLSKLLHIQCWAHKLDKVVKVFSDNLEALNTCVSQTRLFFKNTRKRKHRYQKYLKEKYLFNGKKEIKHFPIPIMTRWGSWRKSVVYLCGYLEDVANFAKSVPRKESPQAVQYFQKLSSNAIAVINAEAVFVREYCTPVSELLLELESSCKALGHVLYPKLICLSKTFETIQNATKVDSVLNANCKAALEDFPITKLEEIENRFKLVAERCNFIINNYMSEDPAKDIFTSLRDLFNPTKIVLGSVTQGAILRAKSRISLFDTIPDDEFKVLHGMFCDNVKEILSVDPKLGTAAVLRALEAMRGNHSEFVKTCLQSIYMPVANVDSERGFSAYGNIVSPNRTRLSKDNAEVMMCLYFGDDPNNNDYSYEETNQNVIPSDDEEMEDVLGDD